MDILDETNLRLAKSTSVLHCQFTLAARDYMHI